jgi:hypothetical protein
LGGAALQRCGKCIVLNAALTAEGAGSARAIPKEIPNPLGIEVETPTSDWAIDSSPIP